eukprot:9223150-Pyramimonas_sp.AAC.1
MHRQAAVGIVRVVGEQKIRIGEQGVGPLRSPAYPANVLLQLGIGVTLGGGVLSVGLGLAQESPS